ncbi:MAG: septal ring lytic transglycosylase RlpA family protein [Cyanobacteria bacterium P01_G01_bin.54]
MSNLLWGSVSATVVTTLLGAQLPAIASDLLPKPELDKTKQGETVQVYAASDETGPEIVAEPGIELTASGGTPSEAPGETPNETGVDAAPEAPEVGTNAPLQVAFNQTVIYPHQVGSAAAATLFVNQIPVVTFLGDQDQANGSELPAALTLEEIQAGQLPSMSEDDPLWRAAQAAEQISQVAPDVATEISLHWDDEQSAYAVQLGEQTLLTVDRKNILPKTTRNLDQDALSVTNLLRRQVGNAPALSVPHTPRPRYRAAINPRSTPNFAGQSGEASWYGPGFHGRRTANGERFNQNAMTAAHRTLPFGTQVRVTNLSNGRSAIVRINDRGPFIHGRVIDLSRGAASAIGMLGSGVAPVQVEVLGR